MSTRRKSGQEAPAAGSLARPLHGRCYEVAPCTDDGPEFFSQPGLAAMDAALSRASHLGFGPVQEVIVHAPGEPGKVLWRFEHGTCTLRPAVIIPARPAPRQRS